MEINYSVGVKNYQTAEGWRQAFITQGEEGVLLEMSRSRNAAIFEQCVRDASDLLARSRISTPKRVFELALFLAGRQTVNVSRLYDEFLKAKIEAERHGEVEAVAEAI